MRLFDSIKKGFKKLVQPFYQTIEEPNYSYSKIGKLRVHESSDPKFVKDVLKDDDNFPSPMFVKKTLEQLVGKSLPNDQGESWQVMHDVLWGSFAPSTVRQNLVPMIIQECDAMLDRWQEKPNTVIDVEHEIVQATGNIIVRHLLGDSMTQEQSKAILSKIEDTFRKLESPKGIGKFFKALGLPYGMVQFVPVVLRRVLGLNSDRPAKVPKSLLTGLKELDEIVFPIIQERRKLEEQPNDVLGALINAENHEGRPLTDKEIKDQIAVFIVAGHETTAASITFAIDELMGNKEAQKKIRDEFNAASAVEGYDPHDLKPLSYTKDAFREGMRMHPAISTTSREAQQDMEVAGKKIRKRDLVKVNIKAVQNLKDIWKDPEVYRPERFSEKGMPVGKAYMPFGAGPRVCTGMNMAMAEGIVFLSRIFNRFTVEPEQRLEGEKQFFSVRPKGKLLVKAEPRNGVV